MPAFRLLMEAQVTIHLSGGIAEAIHRGERRRHEVLRSRRATATLTLT
jgi:predicted ATPase